MSMEVAGFDIEAEVGRGGFGVVYRARQLDFGRLAAIKVMLPGTGPDDLRRRFTQECRAIGALRPHPNVVTVYSTGTTSDGAPYLAMQYLDGGSLAQRTPLPAGAVAALGARLADGLGVAHEGGVIHRDVKPANILFDSDAEPVLVDFGISTMVGDGTTTSSDIALSVAYAPPEILRGERAGVAADVYALGATLFAAVTGRAPFTNADGATPLAALTRRILIDPVEDLRPAGVPDALCAVIERCMAKDEARRYASMSELRAALLPIEGDAVLRSPAQLWGMETTTIGASGLLPGGFDPDPTTGRRSSPRRSRKRLALAAAAAVVVLGGAIATAVALDGDDTPQRDTGAGPVGSSGTTGTASTPGSGSPSAVRVGRSSSAGASGRPTGLLPPVPSGASSSTRPSARSSTTGTEPAGNHAPVLGSIPMIRTDERRSVDASVVAADADGDTLRFRATGLPAGLQMSSSGRVTGRVATSAAAVTRSYHSIATERFPITVTVVDAHGAATTGRTSWSVHDTTTRMPNYHLKRGCDGQGSCHESVPNIRDLGPHTVTCRENSRRAGLILSQSVPAGTSFGYGTKVRYVVARKSC